MPKGPQGQWKPKGAVAYAVHVGKIATGEIEETYEAPTPKMPPTARHERASRGGKARAEKLSARKRKQIARKAAEVRWAARYGEKEAVEDQLLAPAARA